MRRATLPAVTGPIDDVTVLDLTEYIAGPYATKLLADFGANVIKVERPGGDPARRLGPFPGDQPHPERSGTFFYFNTNTRSVALDLKSAAGREAFDHLLGRADVVVESFRPGVLDGLGLGWEHIHARRSDLPLVSISNFGQEGPYRDYQGTDLTLYGYGGELYTMGIAEREPVKMFGTAAMVQSGAAAATAIFGALMVGRLQGIGQHVDFAITDSHILGADRRHVGTIAYTFSGRESFRPPREGRAILWGVYPCADGFIEFSAAGIRMDRFAEMIGRPEWIADPKWSQPGALGNPALAEEFEGHWYAWLSEHTREDVWDRARAARVLCGPLFSTAEIMADPHFRERGFWARTDHPALGEVEFPGRPFLMPDSPWELRRPAPLYGEHTLEVLRECGYPGAESLAGVAEAAS